MTAGEGGGSMSRAQGRLGSVLRGKYRLDRVLGIGGMAVVYKAIHRNEAEFAVKMLHPELSLQEDVRTRFLREGKAANSVKHPGAVRVVDDDVAEDGAAFLVMELLDGAGVESLWARCQHRMPVRAALAVADQLLDVLSAAHAKGIVHRDIKPANLFVVRDGAVKVLDFGIARVRENIAVSHGGHGTGTGMLLGTPAFMAPEQAYAKASEIDGQTDVWAVGATVFTLLTGQAVHEGENAAQLLIRAATVRARSLGSVMPEVPSLIAQVIDRALAFEKASRWPTAEAMREAIERASLESFGEPPSRQVLAKLLVGDRGERPELLVTTPVGTYPGRLSAMPGPPVGPPPFAPEAPTPFVPQGGLPSGGTTAQPVESLRLSSPRPGRRGSGSAIAAVASVVAVAVVLVGGGLVVGAALNGRRGAPAPAVAVPSVAAAMPAPSSPASATLAPDQPPAATSVSAAAVAPSAAPAMTGRPAARPASSSPAPKLVAAPATAAPPPVPAPQQPAAATTCDPPTWTDSKGHLHIKPGC
jgi:eukaryotic-like serine/threonine-protein kinase